MKTFKPSPFQQRIFDFVKEGSGSAIVMAVAGSGKTTTIIEALKLIPASQKVLFLAFNKSIADELSKRIPAHATAKTTHSLGMGAVKRWNRNVRVDGDKMKEHLASLRAEIPLDSVWRVARPKIAKLCSLAKNHGIAPEGFQGLRPLMPDTAESWNHLLDHFDVLGEGELQAELLKAREESPDERAFLIAFAKKLLTLSLEDESLIDFDDMIYLPVVRDLVFEKYDWIFIDEAQDIASIQLEMLRKALKPGSGRLVAVGDPHQAIYGFRGADAEALRNIARAFNTVELPLSISYRCAQSVVREAQTYVSHIQASETAEEGEVKELDALALKQFQVGDLVLCRLKAPIVKLAYRLVAANIPASIIGRDIGAGIISLIEKMRAKSLDDLWPKVQEWHGKQVAKKLRADPDADCTELDEKRDMLETVIANTHERTIPGLLRSIEALFSEKGEGAVRLSTVHKAKGLEADRVYWLEHHYFPRHAKQDWQVEQENNLRYVAVTRAKKFLGMIELNNIQ